jgi:hypothetical protein
LVAQVMAGFGSRDPSGNNGRVAIHKPGDGLPWCIAGVQCDDPATFLDTPAAGRIDTSAVSCNLMGG